MAQEVIDVGSSAGAGNGEILRNALIKANNNFTELYDGIEGASNGFLDYNDSGTSISVTLGGSPVLITNNGLGTGTNKTYSPLGVTDIWDSSTNSFDWSELKLGDTIDIRLEFELTTTSVNTEIEVGLYMGTGAGSYIVPFITERNYKNTGTRTVSRYNSIYVGDLNTIENGGQFKISTDQDCSIVVSGWYCKIQIR